MTNKIIFDSSALIMLFAKEPGYEIVKAHLNYAMISSVNVAEVYKYCIAVQKLSEDDCKSLIKLSDIKIIDFCDKQALITARMIDKTKHYGLSLGDRACIALAIMKNQPVLTCDKIWQKVDMGVQFILAR
jgi:PIN domain nuclease of toxin-antitoxin system